MAYRDFFIYSAEALALAGNATVALQTNIDADADFEIYAQAATALNRSARVINAETSSGRFCSDAPLPLAGSFGDGRRPFFLPVAKRLKRASSFTSIVSDESGAPNQIRLAYIGSKVFKNAPFPQPTYVAEEAFNYVVPFIAVAVDPLGVGVIPAGGVGTFNIRIQEDADFKIRSWTIVHDIAIPAASDTMALMQISDATYGYRFMDRPIPIESLGAAQIVDVNPSAMFPFVLRIPKLVRRASLLSIVVANQDAVNPLALRMTLHGSKCYSVTA
jgi:hypothetical protein